MMAGKMKVDSCASSTTLTGIPRSRAAAETAALTAGSSVAATAATAPARCAAQNAAASCVSSASIA